MRCFQVRTVASFKLLCHSLLWACTNTQDVATDMPPDIILHIIDDLGYNDLGFRNSDIDSPVLDRLATEGIVLPDYQTFMWCAPSRSSLLTGRLPYRNGFVTCALTEWLFESVVYLCCYVCMHVYVFIIHALYVRMHARMRVYVACM